MDINKTKNILLNTIKDKEFLKLIEKYKGNEELLTSILSEVVNEIVEDNNPYRWQPVSPSQFLTDPYYLGVNPETGIGVCESIYPVLADDFCKVHSLDNEIEEVILTGSIGYGKSFFMEISLIRELYILSCLKNPQKYFNLSPASKISITIISVTEKQSKKNIFSACKNMIKMIPYFRENFMFDEKRDTESLIFPNNIELFNGTSAQSSAIGLNIYSASIDEANFFKRVKNSKRSNNTDIYDEVQVLYNSLKRRQESRFLKFGKRPGKLYIGSSKVYPDDFTARKIKDAEKINNESKKVKIYVMDYNLWKVNRQAYSKEEFKVEIGGMNSRSRILTGEEKDIKGKVINVPMDFYDKFKMDIDNAIRDIAGEALHTVQPFITLKEKINDMWDNSLERVFSVDKATLSPKIEYMAREYIINKQIPYKERPRYVGVDIGLKKDIYGFAMGYIEDIVTVKKEFFNDETGKLDSITMKLPLVVVEMLLSIHKEEEFGEVELSRVRYLIYQLIEKGYKIRYFSGDGFQSVDTKQILKRKGIKVDYISMDKTPEPYECFRTALYENRIKCIYNEVLEKELNELERDYSKQGKIDHRPQGCFLGDTKIKLLNGENVEISKLVGKENIELYGCKQDGEIIPTIAKKIWKTKEVTEYLKIELDNGEIIKCTPEHKFMLLDGSYKEAQYLSKKDSLMPLYVKHTNGLNDKINHRIVKIEKIKTTKPIPVYDIEVPISNNFALSAGIFVHNSKDLSDAVGQIVYNMHINMCYTDLSLLPSYVNSGKIIITEKNDNDIFTSFDEEILNYAE